MQNPENENNSANPLVEEVEMPEEETVEKEDDAFAEKLANAEKQAAEMQEAFLRAKAEGENIRRRAQEDIAINSRSRILPSPWLA